MNNQRSDLAFDAAYMDGRNWEGPDGDGTFTSFSIKFIVRNWYADGWNEGDLGDLWDGFFAGQEDPMSVFSRSDRKP